MIDEETIDGRFHAVAARTPDAIAFRHEGTSVTYAELAARANAVAATIEPAVDSSSPSVFVVLLADDPASESAAILGVMARGGIAVPVEALQPAHRVRQIVDHCAPAAILARAPLISMARQTTPDVPVLEISARDARAAAATSSSSPDRAAYICYTSGSTGQPKGIEISHRQVLARTNLIAAALEFHPADRHALLQSLGAGHGMSTIWRALLTGATLLPLRVRERGVTGMREWLEGERATILAMSATLFRTFASTLRPSDRLESLRLLRLGGENVTAADFALFKRHCTPRTVFANAYSCSEASTVTIHLLPHAAELEGDYVPIGRALPECAVRVVGVDGAELPPGETGEMVVEGPVVASGYWREPALTAAVFEPVPGDGRATRLRTGDLGRMSREGVFVHAGRRDFRVKIRGFRVELEGIEATLGRAPGVSHVATFVRKAAESELVAVVVADRHAIDEQRLRAFAAAHLPVGSVPHHFVMVDALPLSPGGKIDRARLPALADAECCSRSTVDRAGGSAVERRVTAIWRDVLGHDRFGSHDDFMMAGGDSLRAMRVLTRVHEQFGVDVPLVEFLARPTVASLSARLQQGTDQWSDEAELTKLLDEFERDRSGR